MTVSKSRAIGFAESTEVTTVSPVGRQPSTTERLHAALDGDGDAWAEIVDEYSNLLWWIARSYRLDDATSADVVQTVWLQLVQHGRSITEPEKLAAWLSTTARRESLRRAKASDRTVAIDSLGEQSDRTSPSTEDQLLDEELTGLALAAYQQLGPDCQRLLALLCEAEPKSYAEIAALLGTTPGYIGPTRQRCLTKLRNLMRGMGAS